MTNLHLLDPVEDNPVSVALQKIRANKLNLEQLQNIPNPEPLIVGYLARDSIVVLWSDPKVGKSTVVVDWTMSIACGRPWFGNPVTKGRVCVFAGEGVRGLKMRYNAWMAFHKAYPDEEDMLIYKMMPDLFDEAVFEAMKQEVAEEQPILVVLDTYARAMTGHNENDNRDAGIFVARIEELRAICGSTILLVHHSNSANTGMTKMRGATAIKGALDTEIEMTMGEDDPTNGFVSMRHLICRAQKDSSGFPETPVHFEEHHGSIVTLPARSAPKYERAF